MLLIYTMDSAKLRGQRFSEILKKHIKIKNPRQQLPEVQNLITEMCQIRLRDLHIHCIHSFFATCSFERDFVALTDVIDQTGDVDKNFLFRGVVYNKAKTFGFIEELYCSIVH